MKAIAVSIILGLVSACGTTGTLGWPSPWDTTTDEPPDPGADTGHDPGPDPDDDDVPVVQGPFTFVLRNPHSFPLYVDWTFSGTAEILGGRSLPGGFVEILWFHPGCTVDCEDIPPDECGCVDCDAPEPAVLEVPAGGEYWVQWDGPDVFQLGIDSCGCQCALPEPLLAPGMESHYVTAGVESWSGYACWGGCGAGPDGVIHGAYTDGERSCALADSWLPIEGGMILVLGGAPCWEEWGSGM